MFINCYVEMQVPLQYLSRRITAQVTFHHHDEIEVSYLVLMLIYNEAYVGLQISLQNLVLSQTKFTTTV